MFYSQVQKEESPKLLIYQGIPDFYIYYDYYCNNEYIKENEYFNSLWLAFFNLILNIPLKYNSMGAGFCYASVFSLSRFRRQRNVRLILRLRLFFRTYINPPLQYEK